MSTKYKIRDQSKLHSVSFSVVEWVDVFTRNIYKDVLVENLTYCQKHKGLILYAWCIMTNHVHLIMSVREGYIQEDILRDFKKFTSKKLVNLNECNTRKVGKTGCSGCLRVPVPKIVIIKTINFGSRIIIQLNCLQIR